MILFIYDEIPEETKYYLFKEGDLPEQFITWMTTSHGITINVDDITEEQDYATSMLCMAMLEDGEGRDEKDYTAIIFTKEREEITLPKEYRNILPKFMVKDIDRLKQPPEPIHCVFLYSFAL